MTIDYAAEIARLRKGKGWTQKDLAEALGITPGAVGRWEARSANPSFQLLLKMHQLIGLPIEEKALAVPVLQLNDKRLSGDLSLLPQPKEIMVVRRRVPFCGFASAGTGCITSPEECGHDVDAPLNVKCDYAVEVRGDSMAPNFHDGDMVFFKPPRPNAQLFFPPIEDPESIGSVPEAEVRPLIGRDVLVWRNDEGFLKRLDIKDRGYAGPGSYRLVFKSLNREHRDGFLGRGDHCRIQGVAVAVMRNLMRVTPLPLYNQD